MKGKVPDRLYVEKSDLEDFNILKDKGSDLHGKENKEIFIMAMVLGFYNGARRNLDTKEGYFLEYHLTDEERSLIKAIAINEEQDLDVLLNPQKVYSIAEEYATGGIKYLKEEVLGTQQYGIYLKRLESQLVEIFEKIKSINDK